jgi:small-conductance mechanosensitive channel
LLFAPSETPAQDHSPTNGTVETPAPPTLSDIRQHVDGARTRLRAANRLLGSERTDRSALSQQLRDLESPISSVTESDRHELENLDALELDRLRQKLLRRQAQVEAWNREITAEVQALEEMHTMLHANREFFNQSLSESAGIGMPRALVQTIDELSDPIRNATTSISERLNDFVTLQNRIAGQTGLIEGTLETLNAVELTRRGGMLAPDSEPLLPALTGPWPSPFPALGDARDIFSDTWRDYEASNRDGLILFALMLPLLLFVAWRNCRVLAAREDLAESSSSAAIFLRRPFAAALLIWLLLGPELFLSPLPRLFYDLRYIAILLATGRLVPRVVQPEILTTIRGLIAVNVVNLLGGILLPAGTYGRLFMLAIAIAGAVVFRQFIRAADSIPENRKTRAIRLVTWLSKIAIAALIFAMVSNLYGAVNLGEQTLNAVMSVFVLVLVVFAARSALKEGMEILISARGASNLNTIRRHPAVVARYGRWIIDLLLIATVVVILPHILPWVGFLWGWIYQAANREFGIGDFSISLQNLLALLVGILLAVYISRFIRFVLDEEVVPRLPVPPGAGAAATRLIYYGLLAVGIAMAITSAGIAWNQLALLIGALGVGIGFGLQHIVNDFVSGIVVAFERPFQVGDTIEVGTLGGEVRAIGMRASTIRTFEGAEVIVPNASLISGQVVNWTRSDRRRRIRIPVGVKYGSDPNQVREILEQVATEHSACMSNPPAHALFMGFGDSALNFELRFWIPESSNRLGTTSEVAIGVNDALTKAGIQIPFPQREVHLRSEPKPDES